MKTFKTFSLYLIMFFSYVTCNAQHRIKDSIIIDNEWRLIVSKSLEFSKSVSSYNSIFRKNEGYDTNLINQTEYVYMDSLLLFQSANKNNEKRMFTDFFYYLHRTVSVKNYTSREFCKIAHDKSLQTFEMYKNEKDVKSKYVGEILILQFDGFSKEEMQHRITNPQKCYDVWKTSPSHYSRLLRQKQENYTNYKVYTESFVFFNVKTKLYYYVLVQQFLY